MDLLFKFTQGLPENLSVQSQNNIYDLDIPVKVASIDCYNFGTAP